MGVKHLIFIKVVCYNVSIKIMENCTMNRVMLLYPPGKQYQRSEDRAQCNLDDSAVATTHACNDIGYAAAVLLQREYSVFLKDYQTELATKEQVKADILEFKPDLIFISITNCINNNLWFRTILFCHLTTHLHKLGFELLPHLEIVVCR